MRSTFANLPTDKRPHHAFEQFSWAQRAKERAFLEQQVIQLARNRERRNVVPWRHVLGAKHLMHSDCQRLLSPVTVKQAVKIWSETSV